MATEISERDEEMCEETMDVSSESEETVDADTPTDEDERRREEAIQQVLSQMWWPTQHYRRPSQDLDTVEMSPRWQSQVNEPVDNFTLADEVEAFAQALVHIPEVTSLALALPVALEVS